MFPNTSSQPSPRPIKVPSVTAFVTFLPKVLTTSLPVADFKNVFKANFLESVVKRLVKTVPSGVNNISINPSIPA